jgi:excisionase family DNA binding protein
MVSRNSDTVDPFEALVEAVATRVIERIGAQRATTSKRWLTVREAAEHIGRSPNAVYMMIREKKIPTSRIDNRVMIDARELDRTLERASGQ